MATRTAFLNPQTGAEITPESPDWPAYRCIREIIQVGQTIVRDAECEHWDIPVLHNVNRPVLQKPFGQGEPQILERLQNAKTRVLTSMVKYTEFFKAPVTVLSQSMFDALPEEYQQAGVEPGLRIVVPDTQWTQSGGKVEVTVPPPPMPEGLMQIFPQLCEEIDDTSGFSETLQGQPSAEIKSGKMADTYSANASNMISFRSRRTEEMVERLARLMLHSLVHRLDIDQVYNVVSKYPPHILAAILQRGQRIEWDVMVACTAGTGAVLAQKKQEAMNDLATIDPATGKSAITLETYRERAGIDNRMEDERGERAIARMARAGAMQMQQQGPGGPNGQEQKRKGRAAGNGRH